MTKARLVFLIEFLNGISRNTGKCEPGGFSLRRSHIVWLFILRVFWGSHSFPCRSLLLRTSVLVIKTMLMVWLYSSFILDIQVQYSCFYKLICDKAMKSYVSVGTLTPVKLLLIKSHKISWNWQPLRNFRNHWSLLISVISG